MAADIFLKLAKIEGESEDAAHKGEIEVLSLSFGVQNSSSMGFGSGGGQGKANFSAINLSKLVDKSSKALWAACAVGNHFEDAMITIRKQGSGGPKEYLVYKLFKVIVTGVSQGGAAEMSENVSLEFAKVEMTYTPQDDAGELGGAIEFKYDIKGNATY